MGSIYFWIGNAAPVAQVDVRVPTGVGIGNDFSFIRNGKAATFRATAATTANVTAGLADVINNSTIPEIREVIATDNGGASISLASRTAGVPFPATYAAAVGSGGGAPTFPAGVGSIASAGPNHWDDSNNWRTAAGASGIPGAVAADSAIFESGSISCLYGLDRSGANTLALLEARRTWNGFLGLPRYNAAGYFEDRDHYLKAGATLLNVDTPSQRFKVDNLGVQTAFNVRSTGSPIEEGVPAFLWKGTNVNNTGQIRKGYVGLAFFPGETGKLADLNIGYETNRESDANVWAGEGMEFSATIDKSGGIAYLKSDLITFMQLAGITYLDGDGLDVTTLGVNGGDFMYSSNGTITTLNVGDDGGINFDGDLRACTVTTCNRYGDASRIIDNETRVVWTNKVKLHRGSLGSPYLQLGEHVEIQITKLP